MTTQATPATISQANLDACDRIICQNTGEVFYQVTSESDSTKTYEVRWNRQYRKLTCTCPAGNPPTDVYGTPLYAPRPCKHIRWSLGAEAEYRELRKAEHQAATRQADEARARVAFRDQRLIEAALTAASEREAREFSDKASRREAAAVRRDGSRAYETPEFSLFR